MGMYTTQLQYHPNALHAKKIQQVFYSTSGSQRRPTNMRSQIILRLDGLGAPPIELVQLGTESRKARLEVVSIHTNVHTEGALASRGGLV